MAQKKKPATTKKPRAAKKVPVSIKTAPVVTRRTRITTAIFRQQRAIALVAGIFSVAVWTVLRSITNGVNFDVVGQVGLADQWARGLHSGVQLGSTNYLLKIPFYFVVNQVAFLSPHQRLLVLALLFNLVTFVGLFLIYEAMRRLYGGRSLVILSVAVVWLATIAGNVFWMDYANSRNLETIGGLWFLYLTLKLTHRWRWTTLAVLLVSGVVVFFADPLQWYVCGSAVIIYAVLRLVPRHAKTDIRYSLAVIAVSILTLAGAKGLQLLCKNMFNISFLTAPSAPNTITLHHVGSIANQLVMSTFTVFDASFWQSSLGPNSVRQALNALVLLVVVGVLIWLALVRRHSIAAGPWLLVTVIIMNYVVYVVSGQVLVADTSRYLIMVPLVLVMILAATTGRLSSGLWRRRLVGAWILVILISTCLLSGALVVSWPDRYSKDAHVSSLITFMQHEGFTYALSSRETGITTTYFSEGRLRILPMGCAGNRLVPTDLFYDSAAFDAVEHYNKDVPILLQNDAIKFGAASCSRAAIIQQFGVPKRVIAVPGYGAALVYNSIDLSPAPLPAGLQPIPVASLQQPILANGPQSTTLAKLVGCQNGKVDVMIAHPDDDLLFMNPALSRQFSDKCVRTVFVTAADDGRSSDYWTGRQRGIEAAYATMAHAEDSWRDSQPFINNHPVLVRTLAGHPSVSLVFLRLPDGNVLGDGFAATGYVSLQKIMHSTDKITSIDNTTNYTYQDLVDTLSAILNVDKPNTIYSHIDSGGLSEGDHSDHRAVGALTLKAAQQAKTTATIGQFVGYPSNYLVRNLSDDDIKMKRAIFDVYADQDGIICTSVSECNIESTYGRYLERSYMITKRMMPSPKPQNQSVPSQELPIPQKSVPGTNRRRQPQTLLNLFRL